MKETDMSNPYGDRGNKDLSIANPKGQGTAQPVKGGGKSHPAPGGPFLIGDTMTGGYGKGPDILHGCTIAVHKHQFHGCTVAVHKHQFYGCTLAVH